MVRVAVIGAGPSGLVTLKYLLRAHEFLGCDAVEARLFETQNHIGGTFRARSYEDAEMVSSKQLTTFSDYRCGGTEDFLSTVQYVEYLKSYCHAFDLWPFITLGAEVTAIQRQLGGGYTVIHTAGVRTLEWRCDAVAICSGLHVEPNWPDIDGIWHVPRVIHSSDFKSRDQFVGSRVVMIVGSGETGADLAYLAATSEHVERVLLCHRDGFHFAPKRNPGPVLLPLLGRKGNARDPGIPIDVSRANLFDTSYVHRMLKQKDDLLWNYYDSYVKILLFLSAGTTSGMDQWVGEISPEKHHASKIFFNKSMKINPYISQPYRPQLPGPRLWLYALRSMFVQIPAEGTTDRRVDLAPIPECIDTQGVAHFTDNGRPEYLRIKDEIIRPDMVVLCTGYNQSFPFFRSVNQSEEEPYPTPTTADVRRIWKRTEPTIGFIGFVRPSLGAIPPLAEMQAQLWVVNLLKPGVLRKPLSVSDESHYRLKHTPSARVQYGVDHESYAYQLALDLDAAPGLHDIVKFLSWQDLWGFCRLIIVWTFGANFNTKFRLIGPWRWAGAIEVLTGDEIWKTITRRPILFGHFAVSLLPILIFGPINAACFLFTFFLELWSRLFSRCLVPQQSPQ